MNVLKSLLQPQLQPLRLFLQPQPLLQPLRLFPQPQPLLQPQELQPKNSVENRFLSARVNALPQPQPLLLLQELQPLRLQPQELHEQLI